MPSFSTTNIGTKYNKAYIEYETPDRTNTEYETIDRTYTEYATTEQYQQSNVKN